MNRHVSRFDVGKIDDVMHGRTRLSIMVFLAQSEVADFTELKTALSTTQGNLSVHLRKLEAAGYITIDKSFMNLRPLTRARITAKGRKALAHYVATITTLVKLIEPGAPR